MTQEIKIADSGDIRNEDWYQSLVDDCLATRVERETYAREIILQSKWEIGKRIFQENERMERNKIYGQRIVENLSQDIGRSTVDLWNCVKFYKEYEGEVFEDEVLPKLPGGKETTWYKMTLLLGNRQQEKREKKSYKVNDIFEAFREWLVSTGIEDNDKIIQELNKFKEVLTKNSN